MEAKARGATVIHVDPRFTRTSAVADIHVPLRAGTDIAFLGGIINYVLENEQLLPRLRASTTPTRRRSCSEDFADTEDLDGLFSGLDREHRTYDSDAWRYEGGEVPRRPAGATACSLTAAPGRAPGGTRRGTRRERTAAQTRSTRRCSTRAASSRS